MMSEIQHELECSRARESSAHEKLSSALRKVDRITTEKNTFAKIVRTFITETSRRCP